jgi:hypothetical protein
MRVEVRRQACCRRIGPIVLQQTERLRRELVELRDAALLLKTALDGLGVVEALYTAPCIFQV